ncbi:S-layer homology domain-containing protein [Candidatus Uhrbacteria bacterium]|nr:S-layer homology domain-containing protein [Candidatus Uhrbacteria bacterium]
MVHHAGFPHIFMDYRPQGKSSLPGWFAHNQTLALVGLFSFMVGAVTVAVGGNTDVLGRLLLVQSNTGCVDGCRNMTCSGSETGESKSWCDAKAAGTCDSKCASMNSGGSYTGGSSLETCKSGCDSMQSATQEQKNSCKTACETAASYGGGGGMYGSTMTPESCRAGCDAMTSGDKDACRRGCDSMGTGGSYTTGTTTNTTGTAAGGSTADAQAAAYRACWTAMCTSESECQTNESYIRYCKQMPGSPTATSTTGTPTGTTPTGTSPGGGGAIAKKCTYPNGTILYCVSDHVGCRRSMNMSDPVLSSAEVGSIGSTANCVWIPGDGSQWGTGAGGGGSSMQRCFYPNAKINGTPPGFTVWCEGDYNNCHEGSPSGRSIPIAGLSLGAPSSCDSGSPGGNYGGGTGGDPREMWIMNCMSQQSLSRLVCEDRCRATGSGCPTSGYGGGDSWPVGDTSPWGRCMQDCRTNNPGAPRQTCDSKCASASWNNGSTSPGWTGGYDPSTCVTGCDRVTGSEADKQSCRTACTTAARGTNTYPRDGSYPAGTTYDSASCLRGCNDPVMMAGRSEAERQMCRDGCNNMGGPRPAAPGADPNTCFADCSRGISGNDPRYAQCRERCFGADGGGGWQGGGGPGDMANARMQFYPLKNLSQQAGQMLSSAKQSGADVGKISSFAAAVEAAIRCVDVAQTIDALNACGTVAYFQQMAQDIWNAIQASGAMRQFDEATKRGKQMQEGIAQLARYGRDTSQLSGILQLFISAIADAKLVMQNPSSGPDQTRMAMQKIYDLESQFWRTAEMYRPQPMEGQGGDQRGVADECEMIRRKQEHYGESDPATAAKLQEYLNQCLQYARKSATGENYDRRGLENVRDQFAGTIEQQGNDSACRDALRSITDTRRMISSEAPQMIAKVAKTRPAAAEKLTGLLAQAKDILARAEKAQAGGDCSAALDAMSDMDALGEQADAVIGSSGVEITFNDTTDYIEDIYDTVGEESDVRFADFQKQMQTKGYRTKDFSLLKQLDPALIAEYLQFTKTGNQGGGDIVKTAATINLDSLTTEKMVETKNDLIKQINELKSTIAGLKAGVQSIIAKIQSYTFNPAIADDVASLVADASSLSETDLAAKFAALKEESQEQNVEDGITAFKDIDPFDGQGWFAGAAKNLAEEGIVKGEGDGRFNPTGAVNGAQLVAFVDRAFDVEERAADLDLAAVQTPTMPAWAEEAALRVGAVLGSTGDRSLTAILPGNAGEPVTRADVAEVLVGVIGDSLPEFDASYVRPDLTTYRESIQEAAARLTEAGIMAGSDDAWKPDADVSRAEMVTVLDRALEYVSQQEDAATADDSADTADTEDDAAFSPDTGDLPRTDIPLETHEAADPAQCIAEMCAKLIIGSMSYNRCKEACYGTQATTADAPPTGDPGFSIDTGVTTQQFKVIMAILANWLSTHKRTDTMYPTALKLQTDLGLALQEHTSYNDPTRLIVPYNKLSTDRYKALWTILVEANQGTMQ